MRRWEKEIVPGNLPHRWLAYVIRCGHPGCQEWDVGGDNIGQRSAHDALPKIFGQRGWTVGTKARHDRCPTHSKKHAEGRRALQEEVMAQKPAVGFLERNLALKPAAKPETHIHVPVPPNEMTKQDRRVIITKLEEVYVDENVGYADGWDDERVATDLGVPVAWVADVREPNFGPNKSQQVAALLIEGRSIYEQVMAAAISANRHAQDLRVSMESLSKLTLRIEKFDKDLKDLAKRAGSK